MPKILHNTKELILQEAKTLLISTSYSDFNIRDLARNCNVSVGTIYNNFPNKHNLILSIFNQAWNQSLQRLDTVNNDYETINEKLFAVYSEMKVFLSTFITVLLEISNSDSNSTPPKYLGTLQKPIIKILSYERSRGNITSPLTDEKLSIFIVSVLMNLCNNETLTFEETINLINFN